MKLYLIKRTGSGESFLKVGVTRKKDANARHFHGVTKVVNSNLPITEIVKRVLIDKQEYMEEGPYPSVTPVLTLDFEEESQALFVERCVIEKFSAIRYRPKMPFDGASECFVFSEDNKTQVRSFIQAKHRTLTEPMYLLRYKFVGWKIDEKDAVARHFAIIKAMEKGGAG